MIIIIYAKKPCILSYPIFSIIFTGITESTSLEIILSDSNKRLEKSCMTDIGVINYIPEASNNWTAMFWLNKYRSVNVTVTVKGRVLHYDTFCKSENAHIDYANEITDLIYLHAKYSTWNIVFLQTVELGNFHLLFPIFPPCTENYHNSFRGMYASIW